MQQATKHGTLSILNTGDLLLDFKDDAHLIRISSDSNMITLKHRTQQEELKYDRMHIPAALCKKYKYAARFVDLVRSKTPKIIFYSPQAKCTFMENCPPDFLAVFHNDVKIHTSTLKNSIDILIPESLYAQFPKSKYVIDLKRPDDPVECRAIVQHAQECLRQCMELEKSSRFDKCTKYPLILKSCHSVTERGQSPTPSISTFSIPGAPLTTSGRSGKSTYSACGEVGMQYLDSVGWCLSTPDKQFVMLFNDGTRLTVHTKPPSAEYQPPGTPAQR